MLCHFLHYEYGIPQYLGHEKNPTLQQTVCIIPLKARVLRVITPHKLMAIKAIGKEHLEAVDIIELPKI